MIYIFFTFKTLKRVDADPNTTGRLRSETPIKKNKLTHLFQKLTNSQTAE